jgi:hypothetical protein
MLARELLTAFGSISVQISDDNLHHVREILDEVFVGGFVSQIRRPLRCRHPSSMPEKANCALSGDFH